MSALHNMGVGRKMNVDAIDTLRTIVGVTDKRMYLELSYIFNKHRENRNSEFNILGESVYSLKKHSVSYFKTKIKSQSAQGKDVLDIVAKYLEDRGVLSILHVLNRMDQEEVSSLVDYLLLPKEIQQEETKKKRSAMPVFTGIADCFGMHFLV